MTIPASELLGMICFSSIVSFTFGSCTQYVKKISDVACARRVHMRDLVNICHVNARTAYNEEVHNFVTERLSAVETDPCKLQEVPKDV